ncbi:MAG: Alkaline phosphatase synthesis sensor protein PhoR [Anaerolineales bacterium]|nr:Alkaline phosphatase synthesis sensor protein PhoR [Anaerolineales bacterium]
MFKTLRAKLIATYAVVVILCLVLAGSAAVYLFNSYQEQTSRRNMRLLVTTLVSQVRGMASRQATMPEITRRVEQLATEVGARLLVLDDQGRVLLDSDGTPASGLRLQPPPGETDLLRRPLSRFVDSSGQAYYYLTARLPRRMRMNAGVAVYLALALRVREMGGAWQELAPSLLVSGGVVFVLATLFGGLLSRSIRRPIQRMTAATEAMAQGDYAQQIAVQGDDEVARLARSFNTMAQEVDRAHRMQRDFVANVSHDLKTPLTSIQGFAQALLDGTAEDSESRRRAAQVIYEEADRMRRLVQVLLELAKLESGQIKLARESIDLGAILKEAMERALPLAETREISVNLRAPASLPAIRGDAHRLSQVFNNLLDNAVAYTPAGGSVEITAAPTSEGTLEIVVSDTGRGIPSEDLPRIFERFYQADKARADRRGTGLGLSIVQEIVAAHGGRVTAASQPDQGTRFTVTLPIDNPTHD